MFNLSPERYMHKYIQFLATSYITIHPLQQRDGINMEQISIRPSAMLGLGQWAEQCNLTNAMILGLCPIASG